VWLPLKFNFQSFGALCGVMSRVGQELLSSFPEPL
jgi:hypothetical protein